MYSDSYLMSGNWIMCLISKVFESKLFSSPCFTSFFRDLFCGIWSFFFQEKKSVIFSLIRNAIHCWRFGSHYRVYILDENIQENRAESGEEMLSCSSMWKQSIYLRLTELSLINKTWQKIKFFFIQTRHLVTTLRLTKRLTKQKSK